jgi:diacylglycerol kinase (ATP)
VTVAVLTNATAGRGRHRDLIPSVVDRLGASGRDISLLVARTRDEALAACQAAVAGGAEALVAVGGDGTLHLALQAVAGRDVPFGLVAAGTGNDFAAQVGLPTEPLAGADAVAKALVERRTRDLDLALLTGPAGERIWYGAVLAAGFDAIVNERANRMRFPRGPRKYDVAIVGELLRLATRRYTITLDDEVLEVDAILVAVGNTASYGGGMRICPAADPTDGLLDVVVGGAMGRATMMRIKPRLYAGTHVDHPLVTSYRARSVQIGGPDVVGYADGERVCPLPVAVASVPGALKLLV